MSASLRRTALLDGLGNWIGVPIGALAGCVIGLIVTEASESAGSVAILTLSAIGGAIGVIFALASLRRREPAEPPPMFPTVEEIRVRANDMVTCRRGDERDVHFLQVTARDVLVAFDVHEDLALFPEGEPAMVRFPSEEFVVVREAESRVVLSIDGVTSPITPLHVLDDDELAVDGLWHLDVLEGTLDDLQGAIDRHVDGDPERLLDGEHVSTGDDRGVDGLHHE